MQLDFSEPKKRNPMIHKPHEVYQILRHDAYEEWERLAKRYRLSEMFPEGTDLSRVPTWVHRIWEKHSQ